MSRWRRSPRSWTSSKRRPVLTFQSMSMLPRADLLLPSLMHMPVGLNGCFPREDISFQSMLTCLRNFELPRVKSINTSGHKFGLVYAGVGWIIWRDEAYLPKHLIFELHYLGGTEESYTLNFSRPGAQIIAQYYMLIHLGFEGFRAIMENCL